MEPASNQPPVCAPVVTLNRTRIRVALAIAVIIDALQIFLFPTFVEGFLSPFEDLLDGAAFLFFWWLLGWHVALLPGFAMKLVPVVDLAPTWTIAVAVTISAKKRALERTARP